MNITVRPAEPGDMKFVLSSWKRTWRVCPWAGVIRNDQFFASISDTIEGLILRGARIWVATPEGQSGVILGWLCCEVAKSGEAIIHYVYVKDPYLGAGIETKLYEAADGTKPGFYTFRYRQVVDLCGPKGFRHAPEIARRR